MDPATMWILGIAFALLPFALMLLFNGTNEADSRGRRIDRRWKARAATAPRMPDLSGPAGEHGPQKDPETQH